MSVPTSEDIHAHGLAMLAAALDARTEADARLDARSVINDLPLEALQRVATWLAVETVWHSKPRRSRRAFREWVELRRFQVLMSTVKLEEDGS